MGKIIVLEDNREMCEVIAHYLADLGHEILCFADPTLAFLAEKNYSDQIKLFIFDINLPNYSGIEVGQLIKKLTPGRKMICISGNIGHHEEALKGLHPLALIHKPFSREELLDSVKNALD